MSGKKLAVVQRVNAAVAWHERDLRGDGLATGKTGQAIGAKGSMGESNSDLDIALYCACRAGVDAGPD